MTSAYQRSGMTVAFLVGIDRADPAIGLVRRIAALGRADIDLVAIHAGPLAPAVDAALDRVPGVVERIAVGGQGGAAGALRAATPLLRAKGYDVLAWLGDGTGPATALDIIGEEPLVATILDHFAGTPDLMLVGAAALECRLPSGSFFDGGLVWARAAVLERAIGGADGDPAGSLDRRLGGAALALGGRIGLVDADGLHVPPPAAMQAARISPGIASRLSVGLSAFVKGMTSR